MFLIAFSVCPMSEIFLKVKFTYFSMVLDYTLKVMKLLTLVKQTGDGVVEMLDYLSFLF